MKNEMQNEDQVGTYEQAAAKKDIADGFKRSPIVAGHDRAASTGLPSNPKGKLSRGVRKMLLHLRCNVIRPVDPVKPKEFAVRFATKLTTLKLTQLVRRQKKFAREASTARHLIAAMAPGHSRLKSMLQARQDDYLAGFNQICAEIKARALASEGKLAEAV